ncbi:COX15/CtaA family protein [Endozoicomonas numazuensis]|uniref:COX15/CtaA family protein n=1 Tax=Endozoicomonas numazuensis TaxID=1137799 RepID=UPI0006924730|nr:COX15/CtaA family protein [Endozoicomonas numazuensis]
MTTASITKKISRTKEQRAGFYLSLFATLLAAVVVGLGAYTRLVHAGLGCPDWPGCYGFLTVPETAQEIAVAETLFPNAPVEVDKGWAEMVHRYVAGSLLILVLMIAIQAFRNRKEPGQPVKLPLFILGLIILQAAFGMWTVTLKLWPQIVTAHLLGGFATFSLLFLLTLRLSGLNWTTLSPSKQKDRLQRLAVAGLLVVILQITLGGWISSNYAALACPDFPMCQGQWLPAADFADGLNFSQSIGPNYLGGKMDSEARTAIHLLHRLGALVTTLLLLILFFQVLRYGKTQSSNSQSSLRMLATVMLLALLVQVTLGISNILGSLPLSVAVAHNLGGAVLLLTLVALNFRLARHLSEGFSEVQT